ncbi:MAG: hypothetical protein RMM31_06110 [Anaerolineae bacterium]|nr:hypothetical protein [Anaerolineae bacterium]
MVRRILLRVAHAGKERLVEAPTDVSVGRLAEIVGRAFAPMEALEETVRYELCLSGVPLAANERVGRACVSIQPGQALQLRIVRERAEPAAAEAPVEPPKGVLRNVTWALSGRMLAAVGEWGVQMWDAEAQRWQPKPVVSLPVLRAVAEERFLLCALRRGGVALWEFDDTERRWNGRATYRLPEARPITSLALNPISAVVGTEFGDLYWFALPDLQLDNELQPKPNAPVRLLHWIDAQHCVKLSAGSVEVWRSGELKPTLEAQAASSRAVVGAVTVSAVDTGWGLLLFTEPMCWMWVSLSGVRPIATEQSGLGEPVSLAYGARSRTAWVGFADGAVEAWQVGDVGQPLERRARHTLCDVPLRHVLLSQDERWLVSIDQHNQIRLHSIQDLRQQ